MATNTTAAEAYSHPPESFVITIILVLILIASIVLNVLFTVVFIKVKYAKDSSNFLLLNMIIADLISTVIWLLPSVISAAAWKWLMSNGFCLFQGFISNWCYIVNMHTFLAVAIEKFLRFWKPSKHKEVFYKTVVLVLIFGIWVFDMVIALFPFMGFGTRGFSLPEFQCTLTYLLSRSNMWFTFFITFLIPLIAGLILYTLIYRRIRKIRTQISPGRPLVLEEAGGKNETYVAKFNNAQNYFKLFEVTKSANLVQNSHNQPPLDEDDPGYGGSEESDTEENSNQGNYQTMSSDYNARKKWCKFVLKEFDYKLTTTVFLAWLFYQLIWFLHYIMTFYWAYNFRPEPSYGVISFFTVISFLSLIVKPIIYATNKGMRRGIKMALCKRETEVVKMRYNVEGAGDSKVEFGNTNPDLEAPV